MPGKQQNCAIYGDQNERAFIFCAPAR